MSATDEIQALKLEAAKAEKAYWDEAMAQKMAERETWKLVHAHWALSLALRRVEVLRVPAGLGDSLLDEAVREVAELFGGESGR
jgi:hypothetical protein